MAKKLRKDIQFPYGGTVDLYYGVMPKGETCV
jgi:hypothetical protein